MDLEEAAWAIVTCMDCYRRTELDGLCALS